MGHYSNIAADMGTWGEAQEDAYLDRLDGKTVVHTPCGEPVRILGSDPRSEQALAYQRWIEEQSEGLAEPSGYYEGQDYPTIEEMAWEEPEEVQAMRQEQAARLRAMSDEERQAWLDEQNEEAGRRFDARGGQW